MDFYDAIAESYDEITNLRQRSAAASAFVDVLLQQYEVERAVDAACGNGLYTMQLAQRGVETTGVDISAELLKDAEKRATMKGLTVHWRHQSMQALARAVTEPQCLVLCMGNSLPHLIEQHDFNAALSNFREVLKPGGILVLQLLNYDKILRQRERIVGITRHGDREFIRFYDFLPNLLRFNVLTVRWQENECVHDLRDTLLYPYTRTALEEALRQHDFQNINCWGSLQFEPFEPEKASTLMIIARKPHSD